MCPHHFKTHEVCQRHPGRKSGQKRGDTSRVCCLVDPDGGEHGHELIHHSADGGVTQPALGDGDGLNEHVTMRQAILAGERRKDSSRVVMEATVMIQ